MHHNKHIFKIALVAALFAAGFVATFGIAQKHSSSATTTTCPSGISVWVGTTSGTASTLLAEWQTLPLGYQLLPQPR